MKRILLLFLALTAIGCNRYDIDEILVSRNDISLTWKGVEQFSYDPATCQMGFNASKNEFRAQTDNLSEWYIIERVSEGPVQLISASVSSPSVAGISDKRMIYHSERLSA